MQQFRFPRMTPSCGVVAAFASLVQRLSLDGCINLGANGLFPKTAKAFRWSTKRLCHDRLTKSATNKLSQRPLTR